MSHVIQGSFELKYPTTNEFTRFTIRSNALVRPEELLTAVVKHGSIKMYGLVDKHSPETMHTFFIVGTGRQIPDEYVNNIYHVASFLLSDEKFGYHIYGLKAVLEVEEKPYKFVEIVFKIGADPEEVVVQMGRVHHFVAANAHAVRYEPQTMQNVVLLGLRDKGAGIEREEEFLELRQDLEDDQSTVQSFRVYSA
jgi:hypothetical protein